MFGDLKINHIWHNEPSAQLWHGTAVCGEIYQECKDIEIDVYPAFGDVEIESSSIVAILEDILKSEKNYNIINMSLGIEDSAWVDCLQNVCDKLLSKGSILVAAFGNNGAITYPACLDSVIGVDLSSQLENNVGYTYIETGAVNVLGYPSQRNVFYPPNTRKMAVGTSFFCAHVTGMICKYISETVENYTLQDIKYFLKHNASDVKSYRSCIDENCFKIRKAVLFPFSKEILTILNLKKYINFEISGVYDLKFSKYHGENIRTLDKDYFKVQSINEIDWNSFDTLVLGHIDNYLKLSLAKYIKILIDKCILQKKQVYAFDDDILKLYQERNIRLEELLYYPHINTSSFPHGHLGKMWNIPVPVVAIMGTRSQQGKFTTQIQINQCLKRRGYRVGLIASEPSGRLFGADYIFPYGYRKMVDVPQEEYAIYINELAYKSFMKGRDILLFAAQAGALPRNYNNMNQCTIMQFSLLFGLSPDIVILCVSPDDEIDLILRTISTIESFSQAVIPCIMVNPVIMDIDENGRIEKLDISQTDLALYESFVSKVEKFTGKSVYKMNEISAEKVTNEILSLLEEG